MRLAAYMTAAVLGVACAALVIVFCAYAYAWWIIAVALAVVIFIPVGSLLHELGHKLFGAMAHVKTKMHYSVFGAAYCDVWTDKSKSLRSRLIVTTLGGLAVNLLCIILGIIALCVHAVPVCISFVLPASVYLFVLNAFPCYLADGDTDGMAALGLIRMDDEARVTLAVMSVQADVESGTPLADIAPERLEVPQIQEDSPAFAALLQLKEQYYTATGDESKAAACRDRQASLQESEEDSAE